MKKVNVKPLDLDPETLGNLTEEEAAEVSGGNSCGIASCNNNTKANVAEIAE